MASHRAQKFRIGDYISDGYALGKGQFGTVYRGVHAINHSERVAIKVIDKKALVAKNRNNAVLLAREITILRMANHKNIAALRYEATSTDESVIHLVLEFCNYGTLRNYLKVHKKLSEADAKPLIRGLADGLLHLRSLNVVHRDLKPDNLMLHKLPSGELELKIVDLGFARILTDDDMTMSYVGTPLFMAPEVIGGRAYTAKADLWSVGVILYVMLLGEYPVFGKTQYALQRLAGLLLDGTHAVQVPTNRGLTPACVDLLSRLLMPDASQRIGWEDFFCHPWLGFHDPIDLLPSMTSVSSYLHASQMNVSQAMAKEPAYRGAADGKQVVKELQDSMAAWEQKKQKARETQAKETSSPTDVATVNVPITVNITPDHSAPSPAASEVPSEQPSASEAIDVPAPKEVKTEKANSPSAEFEIVCTDESSEKTEITEQSCDECRAIFRAAIVVVELADTKMRCSEFEVARSLFARSLVMLQRIWLIMIKHAAPSSPTLATPFGKMRTQIAEMYEVVLYKLKVLSRIVSTDSTPAHCSARAIYHHALELGKHGGFEETYGNWHLSEKMYQASLILFAELLKEATLPGDRTALESHVHRFSQRLDVVQLALDREKKSQLQ